MREGWPAHTLSVPPIGALINISDMSSTSGYTGATYLQEFGPRFFDMSSASGYMGEKYFQEFGPRFLDMSYCQKGSHLQRGVDFCCQTGLHRGVIIMKSSVTSWESRFITAMTIGGGIL